MEKYFSKDLCIEEEFFKCCVEKFGARNALDKAPWMYIAFLYAQLKDLKVDPGMGEDCCEKIEALEKSLKALADKVQKETYRTNWLNGQVKKLLDLHKDELATPEEEKKK